MTVAFKHVEAGAGRGKQDRVATSGLGCREAHRLIERFGQPYFVVAAHRVGNLFRVLAEQDDGFDLLAHDARKFAEAESWSDLDLPLRRLVRYWGHDIWTDADEDGTLSAYLRNGQGVRWTQDALGYRGLSRPTPVSSYVAVGDFEGYIHLVSQVDGTFAGRVKADGDGVRADMLSDGNVLYVFGNSGKLVAYEITAR